MILPEPAPGKEFQTFRSFNGFPLPDPLRVLPLAPGERCAIALPAEIPGDPVLVFLGFPGGCADRDKAAPLYKSRKLIQFDTAITLDGMEIYRGPLYQRSHLYMDPVQRWPLKPDPEGKAAHTEKRRLELVNYGPGTYCLLGIELEEAAPCFLNDPADEESGLENYRDLLIGPGYEFLLRREIIPMIRDIKRCGLGNYVIFRLDNPLNDGSAAGEAELISWADAAGERGISFSFMAFRAPGHHLTPEVIRKIKARWGDLFVSCNFHELGSIFRGSPEWWKPHIPAPPESLTEAFEWYRNAVESKRRLEFPASIPAGASEPNILSSENLSAGIDIPLGELYPAHCAVVLSSVRGAAVRAGVGRWGVHLALLWYLQAPPSIGWDSAVVNRFRITAFSAYLSGARIIYPESGIFDALPVSIRDNSRKETERRYFPRNHPRQRALRQVLKELSRFHRLHCLPPEPEIPTAVMKGHLDPFNRGRRRGTVMGNPALSSREADSGWDLLRLLIPDCPVFDDGSYPSVRRWISGTPRGQFDIIPADTPSGLLASYRFIFIPGWNTMTGANLRSLTEYVRNGGTAMAALPQFRTDDVPDGPREFDQSVIKINGIGPEIFHVFGNLVEGQPVDYPVYGEGRRGNSGIIHTGRTEIPGDGEVMLRETGSGEPVLVKIPIGKGTLYFWNVWEYPGHPLLLPLVNTVMSRILPSPGRGEGGTEVIQRFDYRGGNKRVSVFLDTRWENNPAGYSETEIRVSGRYYSLRLEPGEIRLLYRFEYTSVLVPETLGVSFKRISDSVLRFELRGMGSHRLIFFPNPPAESAVPAGEIVREWKTGEDGTVSVVVQLEAGKELILKV